MRTGLIETDGAFLMNMVVLPARIDSYWELVEAPRICAALPAGTCLAVQPRNSGQKS